MTDHWVVYCFTRLQDGQEEYTKMFSKLDEALAYINKHADGYGCQNKFHLFELGKRIPIEEYKVKEPVQVEVKEVTKYKIRGT